MCDTQGRGSVNIQSFSSCPPTLPPPKWLEHDGVKISWDTHQAEINGKPLRLDPRSFALLYFLVANRGRVLSRQQLIDHAWGAAKPIDDHTINVYVCRVREVLAAGGRSYLLKTVRGCGYCFGGEV